MDIKNLEGLKEKLSTEDKAIKKVFEINDKELAQQIYKLFSGTKLAITKLLFLKFGADSFDFKYLKKEINRLFHNQFIFSFRTLEKMGFLKRCECLGKLKDFPSECKLCGGVGYINAVKGEIKNGKENS